MLPKSALGSVATWEAKLGNTAVGPAYDSAVTIACNADMRQRRALDAKGNETLCLGKLFVEPDEAIEVGDRITLGTRKYVVIDVETLRLGKRVHHLEVSLGSIAQ